MSEILRIDPARPREVAAALSLAAEAVRSGLLVVMPTETVPGIACRPDDRGATGRLFEAKRRPAHLSLPVLAASARDALELAIPSARAWVLAEAFWPGPLTVVLPRSERSSAWELGEHASTIALRVPAHAVAVALLGLTGPLAVSSANRSGEPPLGPEDLVGAFGDEISIYVIERPPPPAPDRAAHRASTVVDLAGKWPRVLRAGPVSASDLAEALGVPAVAEGDSID